MLVPIIFAVNVSSTQTRNSSGDEIANVNFLYDDIVHVHLRQNTIDLCINSATDRLGYVLERALTKFCEITHYNDHFKGHRFWYQSKAHTTYLLVVNTNLPPILHCLQVMADYWSNFR